MWCADIVVLEHRPTEDFHSFPSGHVALITIMVVAFWHAMSSNFKTIGSWLILLVACRAAHGAGDFPVIDTVGGFLVALVGMIMVRAVSSLFFRKLFRISC